MAKKKSSSAADVHAISFFGFAEQYQRAANLLHDSDESLKSPIYFMYLHAIELALKAFLRSHDISSAGGGMKHHQVTKLYEECHRLGLRIGSDDFFDIRNVAGLLEGANEEQGLRYFKMTASTFPELSWTRDVTDKLLRAVEQSVKRKSEADGRVAGSAIKIDITVSKPTQKPGGEADKNSD